MLSLILFILILGLIVLIHEFGHFLFAKLSGTYVYEFSIGMGKRLWYFKKGETEYSIRLIPIGGFVRLAGEEIEEDNTVPKGETLQDKSVLQRFLIMFAGPGMNFVLATFILLISALIFGATSSKPVIGDISAEYPAYQAGLREGDVIQKVNGVRTKTWDDVMWEVQMNSGETLDFVVVNDNNEEKTIQVKPMIQEGDGTVTYVYGISLQVTKETGFLNSLEYAYSKTGYIFKTMIKTVQSLFTGKVGVSELSGPIGIYSVVDSQKEAGLENILYLIAFLSVNVGVINLIPFPAFDGGRILFLFIEKIKGSPVSARVENTIHQIGFFLLLLLMLYVTCNDIFKIFD